MANRQCDQSVIDTQPVTVSVLALPGGLHGSGGAWLRCSSLNGMAIRPRRALACTAITARSAPSDVVDQGRVEIAPAKYEPAVSRVPYKHLSCVN